MDRYLRMHIMNSLLAAEIQYLNNKIVYSG